MKDLEQLSVINRHPLTTTQGTSVANALALMSQMHNSCILVLAGDKPNSPLVGLFAQEDVVQLAAEEIDLSCVTLASVMTQKISTITEIEAQDILTIVSKFRQDGVRYLPVVKEENKLVGIITLESLHGLANEKISSLHKLNQQLQAEIGKRKQAEKALRESEERYRTIFQQAAVGINQISPSGRFIQVNPTFCDFIGYTESELFQKNWQDITHPDDIERNLKFRRQILEGEISSFSMEKRFIRKDGTIKWANITVSLMQRSQIDPRSTIVIIEDISERKKAEEALLTITKQQREKANDLKQALEKLQKTQAQLVLQEKMASLGQLVAGVAHEINNPTSFIYGNIKPATDYACDLLNLIKLYQQNYPEPVASIVEYSEEIDLDFIQEDFLKLLASIQEGAERISEIINSLRNFSRLDHAEIKQVDIHEGIDSALMILQNRLKKQHNRPEILVIKNYDRIPLCECYPGRLNQVFISLLINAIDAIDEMATHQQNPQIAIATKLIESTISISIVDSGVGIDANIKSKIFDPFFTTKTLGKGTGLGLYISCKIIVEQHGGHIKCNSSPGAGAEFAIELPISQKNRGVGNGE